MTVDIIILSDGKTEALRKLTQHTINTCRASEKNVRFNFIVFEKQAGVRYRGDDVAVYAQRLPVFNYNAYMNLGIEMGKAPYIALCNNDLYFTTQWCTNIIEAMKQHGALSASPVCPDVQGKMSGRLFGREDVSVGYAIREQLSGWCIIIDRKLLKVIDRLNEGMEFWASDNVYADQLMDKGVKHILVKRSVVKHLNSQTLKTLPEAEQKKLTIDEYNKYADGIERKRMRVEHALCINLPQARERWKHIEKERGRTGIKIERIDGVDGSIYVKPGGSAAERNLMRGVIGCLLAHRKVIEIARTRGYNNVLVLEDDVQLTKDFDARLAVLMKELPADYAMLFLNRNGTDIEYHSDCSKHLWQVRAGHYGAYGYIVNSKYYDTIIAALTQNVGVKNTDEVYIALMQKLPVFKAKEPVVFHRQGYSYRTDSVPEYEYLTLESYEKGAAVDGWQLTVTADRNVDLSVHFCITPSKFYQRYLLGFIIIFTLVY